MAAARKVGEISIAEADLAELQSIARYIRAEGADDAALDHVHAPEQQNDVADELDERDGRPSVRYHQRPQVRRKVISRVC